MERIHNVTTKRMVVGASVVVGTHLLYWMDCNPSAGNSVWELTDDTTGLTLVVLDEFHTSRESHMLHFDPPMLFITGIYLKTFTNLTSVTFGYI